VKALNNGSLVSLGDIDSEKWKQNYCSSDRLYDTTKASQKRSKASLHSFVSQSKSNLIGGWGAAVHRGVEARKPGSFMEAVASSMTKNSKQSSPLSKALNLDLQKVQIKRENQQTYVLFAQSPSQINRQLNGRSLVCENRQNQNASGFSSSINET